jgi:hypothetical protein
MITSGIVTFMRQMQPAPYESAKAEITLNVSVEEGQDATDECVSALAKAKAMALAELGLVVPTEDTPAETADPALAKKEAGALKRKAAAAAKEAKKAAAERVEAAAAKHSAGMEDDDDETPAGMSAANAEDFDAPPASGAAEEINDADLQKAAQSAAARVTGIVVREFMKDTYKIDQLSKLPVSHRPDFVQGLEALERPA